MNLRSLINDFVVDLGDNKSPQPQSQPTPTISGLPNAPVLSNTFSIGTASAVDSTLATGFIEKLKGKYSSSPHNPIVEQFAATIESLQEFIPEEGNRFRAALKQLQKTQGFDSTALSGAYQSLIGVLQAEATKFGQIISAQREQEISNREKGVSALQQQIELKNKEIADLMTQRDTVAGEIVVQKTKLDTAENTFEGAVNTLRGSIEDQLRKIQLYIPATTTPKQ
jgi:hypothetical protein